MGGGGWTRAATLGALAAATVMGCGGNDSRAELPAACRSGERALQSALAAAPAAVTIEGTRLSDCLVAGSEAVDVQTIGAVYLSVAADLAGKAHAEPSGPAATRLGYLVGAVRRGAARTQGIHQEMLRRLEQELVLVNTRSPAFQRGERAGRASG